jgi:hypothetical protein
MNSFMKWLFWVGGVAVALLGMLVTVASAVDRQIGASLAGLVTIFMSAAPFSTSKYFLLRQEKSRLGAQQNSGRQVL